MRISRRSVLASALPLLGASDTPVIDTHTHFYDPTRPQGVPWPPKTEPVLYRPVLPPEFVRMTKPFSVTGTIVVEASVWTEDNQWVLDLARDNPIILGLVGRLEAGKPDFGRNLDRYRTNPKFLGIRQGSGAIAERILSPDFTQDLKLLADAGLELDVVGGPAMLADVARITDRVPNLRIVIDHVPFDGGDTLEEFAKRKQVCAKVSNVVRKDKPHTAAAHREALDRLWSIFGADRVIYGSNWPVSDRIAPYESVFRLMDDYVKGAQAREAYFWKNAKAAYRWP